MQLGVRAQYCYFPGIMGRKSLDKTCMGTNSSKQNQVGQGQKVFGRTLYRT